MYKQRSVTDLFIGLLLLVPILLWVGIEIYCQSLDLLPEHLYLLEVLEIAPTAGIISSVKYLQSGGVLLYAYLVIVIIPQRFAGAHHPTYWCFAALTVLFLRLWTMLAIPGVPAWLAATVGIALPEDLTWLYTVIAYSMVLGPVCLLLLLLIRPPRIYSLGQSTVRYILAVFLGITCGLFTQLLLSLLQFYLPEEVSALFTFYRENNGGRDNYIALLICSPLLEEIGFRGLIQGRLQNYWPTWLAILLGAGLSAFWYGIFSLFCCTFITGIGYGLYYSHTRRIRYCIPAHCLANYVCLLFHSPSHAPFLGRILILFSAQPPYIKLFLLMTTLLVMLGIIKIVKEP